MPVQRMNLGQPSESRPFPNGRTDVLKVGDLIVHEIVHEPGWRWSTSMKPIVGTEMCEVHHQGLTISGHSGVITRDGPEIDLGPGDLFDIPPGHDAWVIGDEPWVWIDMSPA